MFGKNQIVGQRFFKDAEPNTLKVTSRFYTIQGEGPLAGMPAAFVRLTHCNLNCSFCDAYFDQGSVMTFDEIFADLDAEIRKLAHPNVEPGTDVVLVLTGGEPMLQKNIVPFLEEARYRFLRTQIESNGIIIQDIPDETVLVVSPKASEKTKQYLKPAKEMLERADALKFVISADPESPYYSIPDWALEWKERVSPRGCEIYLSPMNEYTRLPQKALDANIEQRSTVDEVISFWEPGLLDLKANEANHRHAAQLVLKYGCRYNLQQHIYCGLA